MPVVAAAPNERDVDSSVDTTASARTPPRSVVPNQRVAIGEWGTPAGYPSEALGDASRELSLRLERCLAVSLGRNPPASGRFVLRFVVGPGERSRVSLAESTLGDGVLESCILRIAAHLAVPETGSNASVRIDLPVTIAPPEPPWDTPAPATRAPGSSVAYWLVVEPIHLRMADRAAFRIWTVARNEGRATVDPHHEALEFSVNGARSGDLEVAFGNGGREDAWFALPHGHTVRSGRGPGESLFPAPGDYAIAISMRGAELSRVTVHVDP